MAGADRYADAVRKATYGRETRVPIVSAIEYWLGSADRIKTLIETQIDTYNASDEPQRIKELIEEFNSTNTAKAQGFYDRNRPMVDNRIDELSAQYAKRTIKIDLTDPISFPIEIDNKTVYFPLNMHEAVSSETDGLSISVISEEDYLLTSERSDDTVSLISENDYMLSLGSKWTEAPLDDPYEIIKTIIYDYDYTLSFAQANR